MVNRVAPQIHRILAGEVVIISADCQGYLDEGETITGAVTVTEETTSQFSISGAQANTTALTINGQAVPIREAVLATVDATGAAVGSYTLLITFVTSSSQTRKGRVCLNVVA